MNILPRDKQIEVIAALCDGLGVRAAARITGVNRGTVASLALRVGQGCRELHDRQMVGLRPSRIELDELWSYVGKKQARVKRDEGDAVGDQYTYVALAASARAIIAYHTGKRSWGSTDEFVADLAQRVLGNPEISTDGFMPYIACIRDFFRGRASHGRIVKTYSVTNLATKEAARRYSPAQVVKVTREAVFGAPEYISTSYVERSHLTLRQTCKRFSRLTISYSKKLDHHSAAVSLYVAHYNLCRVHASLRSTPAMALGVTDRVWSIGDLLDAALATDPTAPEHAPSPRRFRVIDGGKG